MVSPAKQIWKDFSSGKGGNVVSFLMEHEHFTFQRRRIPRKEIISRLRKPNKPMSKEAAPFMKAFMPLQILRNLSFKMLTEVKMENISYFFQEEDSLQNRLTDSIWDIRRTSGCFHQGSIGCRISNGFWCRVA